MANAIKVDLGACIPPSQVTQTANDKSPKHILTGFVIKIRQTSQIFTACDDWHFSLFD